MIAMCFIFRKLIFEKTKVIIINHSILAIADLLPCFAMTSIIFEFHFLPFLALLHYLLCHLKLIFQSFSFPPNFS